MHHYISKWTQLDKQWHCTKSLFHFSYFVLETTQLYITSAAEYRYKKVLMQ